jgi:hypothetical protein
VVEVPGGASLFFLPPRPHHLRQTRHDRRPPPEPGQHHAATKPREAWIDDEFVSEVRAEDVFGKEDAEGRSAYLLFYRWVGGGMGRAGGGRGRGESEGGR